MMDHTTWNHVWRTIRKMTEQKRKKSYESFTIIQNSNSVAKSETGPKFIGKIWWKSEKKTSRNVQALFCLSKRVTWIFTEVQWCFQEDHCAAVSYHFFFQSFRLQCLLTALHPPPLCVVSVCSVGLRKASVLLTCLSCPTTKLGKESTLVGYVYKWVWVQTTALAVFLKDETVPDLCRL